ncbi:MAG: DNA polymerase III subunit beta [Truepera sp.]|nr:DNA polymerase III subunit beta [Truepera sp.]
MHVIVPKKSLAEGLTHVERIIPTRSSNPGLSLVRIELGESGLICSGSNLDIDIEATIPAEVAGRGEIAIPAQVFGQIVRALPGDQVSLQFTDPSESDPSESENAFKNGFTNGFRRELAIESGSYATKLQLSELAAPRVTFPAHYGGRLRGSDLAAALANVRYAVAIAEYQAIFRGVKLEFGQGTRAVATDGFRLAYYHLEEATGLAGAVVLPSRSVDELIKLLSDDEAKLELTDTQLTVSTGRFRLNLKLMEGSFPDYQRVIPSQFDLHLTLDAKGLAEAVSRVALLADKTTNHRVDFFINQGALQITAEGTYGRSQETLTVVHEGPELQMALAYNAKYLVDALQPIQGKARLSLSGRTSPSVLLSLEDPGYLAMVVPLRTA